MARWKRLPDPGMLGCRVDFDRRGDMACYVEGDRIPLEVANG